MATSTQDRDEPGKGRKRRVSCLVWVVAGFVAVILVAYFMLAPTLAAERRSFIRGKSGSNQHEIARALRVYANNNGGYYPPSAQGWQQLLIDETGIDERVFISPFADRYGGSYWYVPGLQYSRLQWSGPEERSVLLYSDPAWNWGEGGHVEYDNADFRYLQTPEFISEISTLTLPDGTPYAPHLDD